MFNTIIPQNTHSSHREPEVFSENFLIEEEFKTAGKEPFCLEHMEYLKAKGLGLEQVEHVRFGKYYEKPAILIPIKNLSGSIQSLQYIVKNSEGRFDKRFSKNSEQSENFLALDSIEDESTVYLAEGYATAASLRSIIKYSDTAEKSKSVVVWALSSQNLKKVGKKLQERFDHITIIAAPDADEAGNQAAIECQKIGISSIFPKRTEPEIQAKKKVDWNDILKNYTPEEAIKIFQASFVKDSHLNKSSEELNEIKEILNEIDDDPCKDFSMEHFPHMFQKYVKSLCETTDAHPIMVVMSTICEMSAFIGTKVCLPKEEYFQNLYPNI